MTRQKTKIRRETEGPQLTFAGVIETADPETGETELMNFYLPAGVTAADLGLERVIEADTSGWRTGEG